MKPTYPSFAGVALSCGLAAFSAAREEPSPLAPLIVQGRSITRTLPADESIIGSDHLHNTDSAALIRNLPGAAVVRNGPQTGIVQLRGLSGDRVAVRVDGMTITPACPNHMDPPLHYAAAGAGDLINLYAGIPPVSVGGDHIGGSVDFSRPDPLFAKGAESLFHGMLGASFIGSQDAAMATSDLTFAQGDAAFQYCGSGATADDPRHAGGTVADRAYETTRHEIVGALRTKGGFIALDVGFSATRDAGTPALPMDMIKDDAWKFGLSQKEPLAWRHETWESHLEFVWADAQNRVSAVQGETPSPGYGLLNFRLAKVFLKTLRVEAGVENLLDKRYAEHLGGVNRVSGGDLAVGERIPGAGRFAYGSVSWEF